MRLNALAVKASQLEPGSIRNTKVEEMVSRLFIQMKNCTEKQEPSTTSFGAGHVNKLYLKAVRLHLTNSTLTPANRQREVVHGCFF